MILLAGTFACGGRTTRSYVGRQFWLIIWLALKRMREHAARRKPLPASILRPACRLSVRTINNHMYYSSYVHPCSLSSQASRCYTSRQWRGFFLCCFHLPLHHIFGSYLSTKKRC